MLELAGTSPPPLGSDGLRAGHGFAGLDHAGLGHTGRDHVGNGHAGRGLDGNGHTGFGHAGCGHFGTDCLETQWLKYELEVVVVVHFLIEMLNHNVAWVWWNSFFVDL